MDGDETDIHQEFMDRTGYWGSAGSGCIVVARDTGRILLALRSEVVAEPCTWSTWGGAVNSGEDPLTSALRELEEESGFHAETDGTILAWTFRDARAGFRYDTYLVPVDQEFVPILDHENDDSGWFDLDGLPDELHPGLRAMVRDASGWDSLKDGVATILARNFPGLV